MISKIALSVSMFFAITIAADITSEDLTQNNDGSVREQKITAPKKKGEKKARREVPLLKLSKLKPKRPGAWYTEQELGRASALLQDVTVDDKYSHLNSASGVMIAQIEKLIDEFGVNRGARLHRAIITMEITMNSKDVSVMEAFANKLVEEDREAFKAYIASIKAEGLQEDTKLFKGGYLSYIKRTLEESGIENKSIAEIQGLLASIKERREAVAQKNTGKRRRSPSPPGGVSINDYVSDKLMEAILLHYLAIRLKVGLADLEKENLKDLRLVPTEKKPSICSEREYETMGSSYC